jgi:hypothetical protein
MSYSVEYDEQHDVAVIAYSGVIDTDVVREAAVLAADTAFRQDTTRILVDCRDVELAMSADELQSLPSEIAGALSRQGIPVTALRRAVVFARDWQDYVTIESAAAAQQQTMRIFESLDEAKAWLTRD